MAKHEVREAVRPEREAILAALESEREEDRAWAVRCLCPCRAGFDTFEAEMAIVKRLCKDPSPMVRKNAMHVFEDAFEMMSSGLPTTPQAYKNEMVARRRQMRFRNEDQAQSSRFKVRGSRFKASDRQP